MTQHISKKRKLPKSQVEHQQPQVQAEPQSEILKLQSTIGNKAVQRLLNITNLPTKSLAKSDTLQREPQSKPASTSETKFDKNTYFNNLRTMDRSKFTDKEMREKFKEFSDYTTQGKLTANECWLA